MSYWGSSYSMAGSRNEKGDDGDDAEKELRESMSLTRRQLEELKEWFKICDKSGKGSISPWEMQKVIKSVGEDLDDDDLREIYNEVDLDNNGEIDFIEFLHLMNKEVKSAVSDEDIEKCCKVFDVFDNGYITIKDLQRVFTSLGQNLTDEELNDMLVMIDPGNDDGLVEFQAFKNYLEKENLVRRVEEDETDEEVKENEEDQRRLEKEGKNPQSENGKTKEYQDQRHDDRLTDHQWRKSIKQQNDMSRKVYQLMD